MSYGITWAVVLAIFSCGFWTRQIKSIYLLFQSFFNWINFTIFVNYLLHFVFTVYCRNLVNVPHIFEYFLYEFVSFLLFFPHSPSLFHFQSSLFRHAIKSFLFNITIICPFSFSVPVSRSLIRFLQLFSSTMFFPPLFLDWLFHHRNRRQGAQQAGVCAGGKFQVRPPLPTEPTRRTEQFQGTCTVYLPSFCHYCHQFFRHFSLLRQQCIRHCSRLPDAFFDTSLCAYVKIMNLELQLSTRSAQTCSKIKTKFCSRGILKLKTRFFSSSNRSLQHCDPVFNRCSILMQMCFAHPVNFSNLFLLTE